MEVSDYFHVLAALSSGESACGTPWEGGCEGHTFFIVRLLFYVQLKYV